VIDYTNDRWPGYGAWHEVCDALGIVFMMFNKRNGGSYWEFEYEGECAPVLIAEHPGASPITKTHLLVLENAVDNYRRKNPNAIAGYGDGKDTVLPRAEWLLYWVRWSLENCEKPVFVKS
jgi:hypothetical protein